MCRWMAYIGEPMFLDALVVEPEHSLIDQSRHAEEGKTTTNGDGFGLGWYGARSVPGMFREVMPAWSDRNLRSLAHQIESPLFFAHVRASTGTESTRANCHPFGHDNWMFMHNGQIGGYRRLRRRLEAAIPDAYYPFRVGTTDSEVIFYLLLANGLAEDPGRALKTTLTEVEAIMEAGGVAGSLRITAAFSDGERLYALRYASNPNPPTLYWRAQAGGITVVSEPLDDADESWTSVDPGAVLTIDRDLNIDVAYLA